MYNLILYLFSHSSVNYSIFFFIPLAKEKALQVFEYARLKAAGEIKAEVRANKLKLTINYYHILVNQDNEQGPAGMLLYMPSVALGQILTGNVLKVWIRAVPIVIFVYF